MSTDPTTWLDVMGALSPVLAAGIAVSGVIGTLIVTNKQERYRQAQERERLEREIGERRWSTLRDERRQAYSDFLASWSRYEEAKSRAPRGPQSTENLAEGVQRLLEADDALLELLRTFNALSLLAPEEVRAAAAGILSEARGATGAKRKEGEEGPPGRFWKAARKDLDIPD